MGLGGVVIVATGAAVAGVISFDTALMAMAFGVGAAIGWVSAPWALSIAMVLSLGGGDYTALARMAFIILAVSGAVSFVRLAAARRLDFPVGVIAGAILLVWLAIRFAGEGGMFDAALIASLVFAWPSVAWVRLQGWDTHRLFVRAALLFTAGTIVSLLVWDPATRFAGFSGNPNRMVFFTLIALPFLIEAARRERGAVRVFFAATGGFCVISILLSGSSQGLAGLLLFSGVAVWFARSRLRPLARARLDISTISATIVATGALVVAALRSPELAWDIISLSDRTPLFRVFIESFFFSPVLGAGSNTASLGDIVDRTAHSGVLAIFYAGGFLAGLTWCALLVVLVVRGFALLRDGSFIGASYWAIVVVQSVQTVQFTIPFWILMFTALASLNVEQAVRPASRGRAPA